jgi:hypothetical protein
MSEIEYSIDALNSLNKFYRASVIVYVEGDDDILFWENVIKKCTNLDFEVIPLGGADEVDKKIELITSNQLLSIAARDSDYLRLTGSESVHPLVIYTFGYSIENSIYTEASIKEITRIWCKGKRININCDAWLLDIVTYSKPLLVHDLANHIEDAGICVTGDNCTRFMKDDKSHEIDERKVLSYVRAIEKKLENKFIMQSISILESVNDELILCWLRGHFLASAVLKYISNNIKSSGLKSIASYDAIYANAVLFFQKSFDENHPHFEYYNNSLMTAANKIQNV